MVHLSLFVQQGGTKRNKLELSRTTCSKLGKLAKELEQAGTMWNVDVKVEQVRTSRFLYSVAQILAQQEREPRVTSYNEVLKILD